MAFGAGCAVLPGQAGPALLLCGEMMCFTHHMRPVFPCPRSSTPPALACLARLWSSARTLSTPSWRGGTPTPPTSSWRRWGGWGWGKQPEGAPHPQKAETAGGGSPPSLGGWKQPSLVPVRGEWDVQGDCPCTLQLRGAAAWWTAGCHGCEGEHRSGGRITVLHSLPYRPAGRGSAAGAGVTCAAVHDSAHQRDAEAVPAGQGSGGEADLHLLYTYT